MTTQAEIGRHLLLNQSNVARLAGELGWPKPYDLDACRESYIRHIREQAAGRAGAGGLKLVDERARLAAEQANEKARMNAVARGELLPREDVINGWRTGLALIRGKMLALPSRVAPLVASLGTPQAVQAKITEFVHEALSEVAGTRFGEGGDDAAEPVVADAGSGEGAKRSAARTGATAKADRQPVGGRKPKAVAGGQRRTG